MRIETKETIYDVEITEGVLKVRDLLPTLKSPQWTSIHTADQDWTRDPHLPIEETMPPRHWGQKVTRQKIEEGWIAAGKISPNVLLLEACWNIGVSTVDYSKGWGARFDPARGPAYRYQDINLSNLVIASQATEPVVSLYIKESPEEEDDTIFTCPSCEEEDCSVESQVECDRCSDDVCEDCYSHCEICEKDLCTSCEQTNDHECCSECRYQECHCDYDTIRLRSGREVFIDDGEEHRCDYCY